MHQTNLTCDCEISRNHPQSLHIFHKQHFFLQPRFPRWCWGAIPPPGDLWGSFDPNRSIWLLFNDLFPHQPSPWRPNWEDMAHQALNIILDVSNYPVLIVCNLGRHRTGWIPSFTFFSTKHLLTCLLYFASSGTVIGCLRKLQHWNIVSVFEEYRRYAGDKSRVQNEQFIELFDTDLVHIPENSPQWLWTHSIGNWGTWDWEW